jgi:hypothetical protein
MLCLRESANRHFTGHCEVLLRSLAANWHRLQIQALLPALLRKSFSEFSIANQEALSRDRARRGCAASYAQCEEAAMYLGATFGMCEPRVGEGLSRCEWATDKCLTDRT